MSNNRKRIEDRYEVSARGLATATEISKEFHLPAKVIADFFTPTEWHHAQVYNAHRADAMPVNFYDKEEIENALNDASNEKHDLLLKAIADYKKMQEHSQDIIEVYDGYFGYCAPDGSNALWFSGQAIKKANGFWYLPNGQRKRNITKITEEQYKRKFSKWLPEEQSSEPEYQYKHKIKV